MRTSCSGWGADAKKEGAIRRPHRVSHDWIAQSTRTPGVTMESNVYTTGSFAGRLCMQFLVKGQSR